MAESDDHLPLWAISFIVIAVFWSIARAFWQGTDRRL